MPESPARLPGPDGDPDDDAIIGVAFKWSMVALAVIVLVGAALWWLLRPAAESAPTVVAREAIAAPDPLPPPAAEMPRVAFVDIAAASGVSFVHFNGATGDKLLPETMGSGAAFFDLEGDGDQDLLLANAGPWPWDPPPERRPTPALYLNDGRGGFRDVTAESGLATTMMGTGLAIADFDGDGDRDVFLATLGPDRLYANDGDGTFTDVTARAGVAGDPAAWTSSAGFFDHDGDGDLDLFVCHYVEWSREIDFDLNFTLNGRDRAYGPPTNYRGTFPALYRNEGDGTFTDVSEEAGLHVRNAATGEPVAKALALTFLDADDDGWLDVVVANDTVRNFLFRNRGDGTFEEIGSAAGLAYDDAGMATGAMGIDAGDVHDDGRLAVAIGNFANESTSFYLEQARAGRFTDVAAAEGIGSPSRLRLSFGLFFFDHDLDGRLDVLQANGHLEDDIQAVQPSQTYRQPTQLFWNAGRDARPRFQAVPEEQSRDLALPVVGRGAAFADVDGDGDLDVVVTQVAGPPLLLRNDQTTGHHWLRVRLEGRAPNTDAIGARLALTVGDVTQARWVVPTRSYLSQVELPVTFGLGAAEAVDRLEVTWPDGSSQVVEVAGVDREITVVQAAGR